MSAWSPLSPHDVGSLSRDEFENLCFVLLKYYVSDQVERVEDRFGQGNGLDAILVNGSEVTGWQFRRYDSHNIHNFDNHHKGGIRESLRKAVNWCQGNGARLISYSLVCNVDLQPDDLFRVEGWFQRQTDRFGVETEFFTLLWVYDSVLRAPREIRTEFFGPSPADLSDQITALHESLDSDQVGKIERAIQELRRKDESIAQAVERLVREAGVHYDRAKQRQDTLEFQQAVIHARDARRLLEDRWEKEQLFLAISEILALSLAEMGAYQEAATCYEQLDVLYGELGDSQRALFSRGNAARMLRDVANDDYGLSTFQELYDLSLAAKSWNDVFAGIFNIANCYRARQAFEATRAWIQTGMSHIHELKQNLPASEYINHIPTELMLWSSLGSVFELMGRDDDAEIAFTFVDTLASGENTLAHAPPIQRIRAQNLVNRSVLRVKHRRWQDAAEDAELALSVLKSFEDVRSESLAHYNLGEANLRLGLLDRSFDAYLEAATKFELLGAFTDQADALSGCAEVLAAKGNDTMAAEYVDRATALRRMA